MRLGRGRGGQEGGGRKQARGGRGQELVGGATAAAATDGQRKWFSVVVVSRSSIDLGEFVLPVDWTFGYLCIYFSEYIHEAIWFLFAFSFKILLFL